VEPFLLQLGFIDRTPRGRSATPLAYKHMGLPMRPDPSSQSSLF
ncbi:Holliday junction branch migration DNA helicase RuvB, partial [bacterium]|nr:Holliday junction branch migration DNA helicase RuvB [bacterium]